MNRCFLSVVVVVQLREIDELNKKKNTKYKRTKEYKKGPLSYEVQ